jgi:hypothetical protein
MHWYWTDYRINISERYLLEETAKRVGKLAKSGVGPRACLYQDNPYTDKNWI